MIGGEFRPSAEGMVGSTAEHQLHDFHVNIAFLGTEGITIEHGLTTANPENADIIRAMCSQADKTILVADSWLRTPQSMVLKALSESFLRTR